MIQQITKKLVGAAVLTLGVGLAAQASFVFEPGPSPVTRNNERALTGSSAMATGLSLSDSDLFYSNTSDDTAGGFRASTYGLNLAAAIGIGESADLTLRVPIYTTDWDLIPGDDDSETYGIDASLRFWLSDDFNVGVRGSYYEMKGHPFTTDDLGNTIRDFYTTVLGVSAGYKIHVADNASVNLGALVDQVAGDGEDFFLVTLGSVLEIDASDSLDVKLFALYFDDLGDTNNGELTEWFEVGASANVKFGDSWGIEIGAKRVLDIDPFASYEVFMGGNFRF